MSQSHPTAKLLNRYGWSLSIVGLILALGAATQADAGLVAHWDFNNNFNDVHSGTYNASLGAPNGGENNNAQLTSANASPAGGQSLLLDGDGDFLTVANTSPLPSTGSYTKTAWAYYTGGPDDWANIYTSGDPGGAHALLRTDGGTVTVYHRSPISGDFWDTGLTVDNSQWTHWALAYDATADTLTTYKNGQQSHSVSGVGALGAATNADNIGAYAGMASWWTGQLDDIRIYNSALSQSEVAALVPEPGSLALASLCALAMLRRPH